MTLSIMESASIEVTYGSRDDLVRPALIEANIWLDPRLNQHGLLERRHVRGHKLAPLIRHASFFELIIEDGQVTDFHAKVIASILADNLIEISGKRGREALPRPLFRRWLDACHHLYREKKCFTTRSRAFGKEHKFAESLTVPVCDDGDQQITHCLVFSDYWVSTS